MRISDWSSDVCSSDLWRARPHRGSGRTDARPVPIHHGAQDKGERMSASSPNAALAAALEAQSDAPVGIGRALIGGRFRNAADGASLDVLSPIDGALLTTIPACGAADVDRSEEHTSELQSLMS